MSLFQIDLDPSSLANELLSVHKEDEVTSILEKYNLLQDEYWRNFGGIENNYSTIGNQQEGADFALVEKLVNSIDAVLLEECLSRGINPISDKAPRSVLEAVRLFYSVKEGKLVNVSSAIRGKLAEKITLISNGLLRTPSYTIVDTGEGQNPDEFADTFLSLHKSNKLKIPFVQGKFNMGGTGVLRFCGNQRYQLIISRRSSRLSNATGMWGVTIVKRFRPDESHRSSIYKYLAVNNSILSFNADSVPIISEKDAKNKLAEINYGTIIKLYNYDIGPSLRSRILNDFYERFNVLLPRIALPVRLIEDRKKYVKGHSFSATLAGLRVRLDAGNSQMLEDGFPMGIDLNFHNTKYSISMYAFTKQGKNNYVGKEGVIFTVNGQFHGYIDKRIFERKSVKLNYIKDSILLIVDCSELSNDLREDLFMNSRDRLSNSQYRKELEKELEEIIANSQSLRDLQSRRVSEDKQSVLESSTEVESIIQNVLNNNPDIANVLLQGKKLKNPYKDAKHSKIKKFEGKFYPTFFSIVNNYNEIKPKVVFPKHTARVFFNTDANNDYFTRDNEQGRYMLFINNEEYSHCNINTYNGRATLNIHTAENWIENELLECRVIVTDDTQLEDYVNTFIMCLSNDKVKRREGANGRRKQTQGDVDGESTTDSENLDIPEIHEVFEESWKLHDFDKESALKYVNAGSEGSWFLLNMDNIYLKHIIKSADDRTSIVRTSQYKNAMHLIGLALVNLKDELRDTTKEELVVIGSRLVMPILFPIMLQLGDSEFSS